MRGALGAVLALVASGCSALVDLDELGSGASSSGTTASTTGAGATGSGGTGAAGSSAGGSGASGGGTSCPPGMADCDQDGSCEATLATDHENCGICGRDCGEGDCSGGVCPPLQLAQGQPGPNDIAYQDGAVYWVNHVAGALMRCNAAGCASMPTQLGASGYWSFFIALDETDVYWNNNGYGSDPGSMWRCPLDGGCAADSPWIPTVSNPTQVGVDQLYTYWHSNDGNVQRAAKQTGVVETLVTNAGNSGDVESDGKELFWTDRMVHAIRGCSISQNGCGAETMNVSGAWQNPDQLLIDSTHVYFATFSGDDTDVIARIDRQSGMLDTLVSTSSSIGGIAMNADHVYFTETASSTVQKVPRAGGSVQVVASGISKPGRLAVGGGFVFVVATSDTDGGVWRYSW